MKRKFAGLILGIVLLSSTAAVAANQTVTFAIDTMTCPTCPDIVKETLASVPGVSKVEVSLAKRTAVVTFDDATTTLEALAAASVGAGFPARPIAGDISGSSANPLMGSAQGVGCGC